MMDTHLLTMSTVTVNVSEVQSPDTSHRPETYGFRPLKGTDGIMSGRAFFTFVRYVHQLAATMKA